MSKLLKKWWARATLLGIAMFIASIFITMSITERRSTDIFQSYGINFHYKPTRGYGGVETMLGTFLTDFKVPLTADNAATSGWSSLGTCVDGIGSAYAKLSAAELTKFTGGGRNAGRVSKSSVKVDQNRPLIAMYDVNGQLIGINLVSSDAQNSPPWEFVPAGNFIGWPGREIDHWGMSVYVVDPAGACIDG